MPRFDPLTGLLFGGNFEGRLERLLELADETAQQLSLALFDLGGLKFINQRFGHEGGDLVLKLVARSILAAVEDSTLCYRLGGDAFVVLLPGLGAEAAAERADKLQGAIAATNVVMKTGEWISLTVFAGVSTFPRDAQHARSLLRVADRRMQDARGTSNATQREPHANL